MTKYTSSQKMIAMHTLVVSVVLGLITIQTLADASTVASNGVMLSPCDRSPWSGYGYCNTTWSLDERLDDLMQRMTLQDKIDAMDGSAFPTVYAECNEIKGCRTL